MTILSQSPEKNFHFFYRSRKVPSAVSGIFQNEKKVTLCQQNFRSHMPQKKYQKCLSQIAKSIKLLIFVDYIYKIVLRLSMFFLVYIFLVRRSGKVLWEIPVFENLKNMGVGLTAILDHNLINLGGTKLFTGDD